MICIAGTGISTLIFAYKGRKGLVDTVRDVGGVSDEIVIIDTSPKPIHIEKNKKVKIYRARHLGYPDIYRTWAFQKCAKEWVLLVDTDERLSEEFKANIRSMIEMARNGNYGGIMIERKESVELGKDWSRKQGSMIVRIFRKSRVKSTGNLHDIISVDGRVLDATKSLVLLHLKREPSDDAHRIQYSRVDILRRMSYQTLLKQFRLPPIFKQRVAAKRNKREELSDLDYLLWYLMLNSKLGMIEGGFLRHIRHTGTDIKNIRAYKKSYGDLFYAIDEANSFGLSGYLGLDKEGNIRKLASKKADGIDLLLNLILEEYKKRQTI